MLLSEIPKLALNFLNKSMLPLTGFSALSGREWEHRTDLLWAPRLWITFSLQLIFNGYMVETQSCIRRPEPPGMTILRSQGPEDTHQSQPPQSCTHQSFVQCALSLFCCKQSYPLIFVPPRLGSSLCPAALYMLTVLSSGPVTVHVALTASNGLISHSWDWG